MFRSFTISLLLATLICPAGAQMAEELPDAPTVQPAPPPAPSVIMKRQSAPSAVSRPIFDRPFAAAAAGLLGSSIANAEAIERCEPRACQDVPGVLRSRAGLYGVGLPADVGAGYISDRLRQSRYHRWWYVPMGIVTLGNIIYAAHALECGGNGCRYFSSLNH